MFQNSVWAIAYPTKYKIAQEKNNIKLYGHHSLKKAIFFNVICGTAQNLRIYFQNLG